jgi:ATP-binding cassette, subfamily B, multidrug efflux pump
VGQLRTVLPYLRRYRRGLALGLASLILQDLAKACLPLMIRNAIDALPRGVWSRVVLFAGLLVTLSFTKGLFQYWMRVIIIGISRDIEYDLRNDLFRHLVSLSPDYYGRTRTGDIMARATNDLNAVRMMLGPGIMYWTETSLTFLLAMIIMVSTDWRLAFLAILPAPAVSLAVMFFGRHIHERFERIQAMFSDISSRVQENLSGVRMIRAFVQEAAEMRRFESLNREYIAQNIRLVRIQGFFQPLLEMLIGFTFLVVLWAGGRQVLAHRITLGSFVMFNTYMGMLVWPMIALGWVVNIFERGEASMGRIDEILRAPAEIGDALAAPAPAIRGGVEFKNLTFAYDGRPVLHDVSLAVPAGTTVAIVGPTGSGKSTLVSLIPRLFEAPAGTVLVDGRDVRTIPLHDLRGAVALVPQETFLFSDTVGENVAFGLPPGDAEPLRRRTEAAAGIAQLSRDVRDFPLGYETFVGERGITLSGGQKQRAALARALAMDPRILILDDALASVDTYTEEAILAGLKGVMAERTTFLVSHRVSTVKEADLIVVLRDGRIVERGTHDELVAAGGFYADLHRRQLLEEEMERTA